jgi:hypothetical protein
MRPRIKTLTFFGGVQAVHDGFTFVRANIFPDRPGELKDRTPCDFHPYARGNPRTW